MARSNTEEETLNELVSARVALATAEYEKEELLKQIKALKAALEQNRTGRPAIPSVAFGAGIQVDEQSMKKLTTSSKWKSKLKHFLPKGSKTKKKKAETMALPVSYAPSGRH